MNQTHVKLVEIPSTEKTIEQFIKDWKFRVKASEVGIKQRLSYLFRVGVLDPNLTLKDVRSMDYTKVFLDILHMRLAKLGFAITKSRRDYAYSFCSLIKYLHVLDPLIKTTQIPKDIGYDLSGYEKVRAESFTLEELRSISRELCEISCHPAYYFMFTLMFEAGKRFSEVSDLTMEDLNFDKNLIKFKQLKVAKDTWIVLPFQESFMNRMKMYLNRTEHHRCGYVDYDRNRDFYLRLQRESPSAYVFVGVRGYRIQNRTFNKVIQRTAEKLGIKKHFSSHSLRTSFVTINKQNNASDIDISEVTGHTTFNSLKRYNHVKPETSIVNKMRLHI